MLQCKVVHIVDEDELAKEFGGSMFDAGPHIYNTYVASVSTQNFNVSLLASTAHARV